MRPSMCLALLLLSGCVRTVILPPLQSIAVRGFVAHAEREWPGTAQQQAQTADTLDWLAMAIQSLAASKPLQVPDFGKRMQDFRAGIKTFAAGKPEGVEQTIILRQTLSTGADLIDDLSTAADLDRADQLQRVANALDVTRPPRQQPETLERFFRLASDALQRLDRGMD